MQSYLDLIVSDLLKLLYQGWIVGKPLVHKLNQNKKHSKKYCYTLWVFNYLIYFF